MSLFVAFALGLGLGIVTGMPLGVVNVAIVDAAAAGQRRHAIGIGAGGALADAIHAALAFIGIGALVTSRPELVRVLAIAAAALIAGYAIFAWRGRVKAVPKSDTRSVVTGFLLTLPNPGALSAWVAVAVALWPGAAVTESVLLAVGVGLGSALWFALLAHIVSRLPREHVLLRVIPKAAIVAFVGIAVVGVVRVL